ncbi:unnamed protein product [Spirodela intermedia]|uniref:mitogen-activated protein kinase kinase kinase n=1 Tax=Spirodela intermedia TaxID=51605 RepID=A0A7I8IV21_SPIIN|nr:unnamed protein product [Spirodela intermedia]CAA6661472.1 unnamed protein product [Spirodela intermedia]
MQEIFGSVRRSLVFRQSSHKELPGVGGGGSMSIADRIGSCLRKSRVGLAGLGLGLLPRLQPPPPTLLASMVLPELVSAQTPDAAEDNTAIRWRKGELIGCGAFGHVYMGMNLDSGELLAVKQVLIGTSHASKQKAQDNIRELEEEVKLLKNLSHPNIVRYLGTAREEDTLNILLEFVPGGSISSLLGKFGSFPEAGANILVDNKGCIKLVDFGASKQVAKLATLNAAKSMKGTPYWMAPEVIVQTGHSFSADIWSVGCTVIEMATGKPPWSQQYQEVAVLYHIGTTKSHPPIPEHLSPEAKDFLLKCLQNIISPTDSCDVLNSMEEDFGDGSCSPYEGKLISVRPIWETSSSDNMCQLDDNTASVAVGQQKGGESDGGGGFTFPCGAACEDDDEVTETKIRAFLDEKALELKKLQTPLYEEFHNTMNASNSKNMSGHVAQEKYSRSNASSAAQIDAVNSGSPGNCLSAAPGGDKSRILKEVPSPCLNQWDGVLEDAEQKPNGLSDNFSERRRKWKEELDQELADQRGGRRRGRTSSPKETFSNRKRDWSKFASTGK